jgi:hypothetical protein
VFDARTGEGKPGRSELGFVRAARRTFTGPTEFLADAGNRSRVAEYVADLVRPYKVELAADAFATPSSPAAGPLYAEMAEDLIGSAVRADEPVDLLVLAFAVHDLRPGRQTAAYLSHLTPGAPLSFAICDQGAAAAFTGLRVACEYARSAGIRRALLVVVEQGGLPYDCPVPLPAEHRGVAMLYTAGAVAAHVTGVRQLAGVAPGQAAAVAAAGLAALAAGQRVAGLVLGAALAAVWPDPGVERVRTAPPGQPSTGAWWSLLDEFAGAAPGQGLVVVADYEQDLGYVCLAGFDAAAG